MQMIGLRLFCVNGRGRGKAGNLVNGKKPVAEEGNVSMAEANQIGIRFAFLG